MLIEFVNFSYLCDVVFEHDCRVRVVLTFEVEVRLVGIRRGGHHADRVALTPVGQGQVGHGVDLGGLLTEVILVLVRLTLTFIPGIEI